MPAQQYVVDNHTVIAKYREQLAEINEQLMLARAAVDELLVRQDQLVATIQTGEEEKQRLQTDVEELTAKLNMVEEMKKEVDELTDLMQPDGE